MLMLRSTHLRKIAELETLLNSNEDAAKNTFAVLTNQIREMDQLIFRMGQCSDWESMRPIFNQLQFLTEARMRNESNRINNLLQAELIKTYAKD